MKSQYSVVAVRTYVNPAADPAFCADVHLEDAKGGKLLLIGVPGETADETFKGRKFELAEVAEQPSLANVPTLPT